MKVGQLLDFGDRLWFVEETKEIDGMRFCLITPLAPAEQKWSNSRFMRRKIEGEFVMVDTDYTEWYEERVILNIVNEVEKKLAGSV